MSQIVKLVIGKRSYCEYKTGEKRHRIYGRLDAEKDIEKRKQIGEDLRLKIEEKLSGGFFYKTTITRCIEKITDDKKLYQKKRAHDSTRLNLLHLKYYFIEINCSNTPPASITRDMIFEYRNKVLKRGVSNRTANNIMIDVNSFFNELIKREIILKNPCKGISKLPTQSERHLDYTPDELKQIKKYLDENDPYLGQFCKFIVYAMLRINEIALLQVKHVDLNNRCINAPASIIKTGQWQVKKIMDPLVQCIEEMKLSKRNKNDYLFTLKMQPGPVQVGPHFFNRKFLKLKQTIGFGKYHTMYGLRHTFVLNLLENNVAYPTIMNLTGHTTLSSFEKYTRRFRFKPALDVSAKFTISI